MQGPPSSLPTTRRKGDDDDDIDDRPPQAVRRAPPAVRAQDSDHHRAIGSFPSADASPYSVVQLAQDLLRSTRAVTTSNEGAHPLAVLLLSLECRLALSAASSSSSSSSSPLAQAVQHPPRVNGQERIFKTPIDISRDATSLDRRNEFRSSCSFADAAAAPPPPLPERSSSSSKPTSRNKASNAAVGEGARGEILAPVRSIQLAEDWEDWTSYIIEVYTFPNKDDAGWTSPLHVPASIAPSLAEACSHHELNPEAKRLLQQCVESTQKQLGSSWSLDSAVLPTSPRSSTDLAILASTLASCRRSSSSTTHLFRRVLSTSLEHLVSSKDFGPGRGEDGHSNYARAVEDDEAIRRYFPDPHPIRSRPDSTSWSSDDFRSITHPDEKPVSPFTPSTPPSPFRIHKVRPMSVGSYGADSLIESPSWSSFASTGPYGSMSRTRQLSAPSETSSIISRAPLLATEHPKFIPRSSPKFRPPAVFVRGPGQSTTAIVPPVLDRVGSGGSANAPPASPLSTTNALTPQERRHLIRQAKKLEHILGAPVEDSQAKDIVSASRRGDSVDGQSKRPQIRHERSNSDPSSPSNDSLLSHSSTLGSFDMKRANSNPSPGFSKHLSPRGAQSPMGPITPTRTKSDASMAAAGREERRQKLAKLHHLLGERVPIELALSDQAASPIGGTATTNLQRSGGHGAKRMWERAKGHVPWHHGVRHQDDPEVERARRDEYIVDVQPECHVFPMASHRSTTSIGGELGDEGGASISTSKAASEIKDLATARKLEDRFGVLPPTALFQSHPKRPSLETRKSFETDESSHSKRTNRLSNRSVRSIDSYRNSIASLRFLMEQDPEAVDRIAVALEEEEAEDGKDSTVTFEDGSRLDSSKANSALRDQLKAFNIAGPSSMQSSNAEPFAETPVAPEAQAPAPSRVLQVPTNKANNSTSTTIRQATKLASFFGTTRGEVWARLLDNLEHAIMLEEDDDMDVEEKNEVLSEVQKLRMFKPVGSRSK